MASRKQHPAELRERAVAMVFELRAESGSPRGTALSRRFRSPAIGSIVTDVSYFL